MSGTKRNLPDPQYRAALSANSPSGVNAFATILDVLAGSGGNRVITGNASYSGTGFIYDVTALTYIIQGVLYASPAGQVTLGAADPTFDRIDVIYADDTGAIGVLAGTPAAVPAKPSVNNLTQVEVTFVTVAAGATSPTVPTVLLYDEFLGTGGGEWNVTATAPVLLNSTADPYQGTYHIATTAAFGSNKYIAFEDAPYIIAGGQVSFWIKAKVNMSTAGGAIRVGFFVAGSLVGNSVTIGGTPASTFGFSGSIIGTYQLVTIPITAFGGLPASIDQLRIFTTAGPYLSQFDLDVVKIEEGVPTPPIIQPKLGELQDVNLDFDPTIATAVDEGKYPYFDIIAGEWITSEEVNHGTVVLPVKKSTPGTIAKGLPVRLVGFDSDLITVELADAASGFPAIGMTTQNTNDTDHAHMIKFGKVTGLNTTNAVTTLNPNGETWGIGTLLYLSTTPGGLTSTRPSGATTAIQPFARVLRVNASGGQIEVFGAFDYNTLPNILLNNFWVGDANGHPQPNTPTQVTALLNIFTSVLKGLVPASGGGTTNFLRADGTWAAPAGGGGSAKFSRSYYAYNMSPAGGYTWNGVSVGSTALTTLNERHRLQIFAGVGGADGCFINVTLPNSYTAGAQIRVTLKLTSGVSGDARYTVGLTQLSVVGAYSNDTNTQYITNTVTMFAGFQDNTAVFTFSGLGISPGEPLAILIYRDPGDPSDTLNSDTYLHQILIEEL